MRFINIKNISTSDGTLCVVESSRDVPFEIQRTYFIYGAGKESVRGGHAHRNLEQVMFVINGSITLELIDKNGSEKIVLDSPARGVYIPKMTWRNFYNFTPNVVILVFASEYYDESDYIRNYIEYCELISKS